MSNRLAHHCDFGINLSRRIELKKYIKAMLLAVREAVRAIKRFLGLTDPSGVISTIINKVKAIVQEIKYYVNTYIKPIAKFLIKVIKFIGYIKAVIAWILGLPARFLKYLRECLTALISAIGKVFIDTLFESDGPDSGIGKDIKEIMNDGKEIIKTISTTVALAGKTVAEVQSLGELAGVKLNKSASSVPGAASLTTSQSTLTQSVTADNANTASVTIKSIASSMPTTASIANTVSTSTSMASISDSANRSMI
jgi:hypothetical protein